MTRARAQGRGRIEVFDVAMREQVLEQLQLDAALRLALEHHEFLPYYQPIIDLKSGRLVGFEALIRWRRPDGRLVTPAVFVPTLEASGLIVPVGRQFTEDVCRQLQAWRAQWPDSQRLWVNVNFASSQLSEPDVLETLLATIRQSGLGPRTSSSRSPSRPPSPTSSGLPPRCRGSATPVSASCSTTSAPATRRSRASTNCPSPASSWIGRSSAASGGTRRFSRRSSRSPISSGSR